MKRKIISIILVVSMTVAFVPSFAFATDQDGGDQLETPETDAETVVEEELEPETSTTAVDEGEGDPANENKTDKSDSSLEGTESTNSLLTNDKNKNQKSASGDEKVSISKDSQTSIKGYDFKLSEKSFIYNGNVQLPDVLCNTLTRGVDYKVHCFSADFYDYEFWYYYDYDYDYDGDYAYYEDSGGYYYSEQYDCYFDRKPISPGTYYVFIRGVGDYYDVVVLKYKILRTTISLNKTSATLYKKGTLQLKATVKNAVGKTTYSSSNTKVATVSSKGKITAKAKGKATITVKNGLTKKKVKITVKNPYLNFKKASLYVAESKTLKVKGKVGEAKFKSSNKKIATVNKSGEME